MHERNDDPWGSTKQVAALCGATESTIRYAARVGKLSGEKTGNAWRFRKSEAQRFCAAWRNERQKRRKKRGILGSLNRARISIIGLIHLIASIISLVTAFGFEGSKPVGVALAVVNLLGAGLEYLRSWSRRPKQDDVVNGQPVDPAAVAMRHQFRHFSLLRIVQTALLLATVAYVAVSVSLYILDRNEDDPEAIRNDPPAITATPTDTPVTVTSTFAAVVTPEVLPTITPLDTVPPVDEPPTPTDIPTLTPTATATFTPSPTNTPCDVDGCPQVEPDFDVSGDKVAPTDQEAEMPPAPTPCDVDGCPPTSLLQRR